MRIRIENTQNADEQALIRTVHQAAFGAGDEAILVDQLRDDGHALLSLVAELGGTIAGHILFSRMWIETSSGLVEAVALAPVAVLPAQQRRGIGSLLIQQGLERLRELGEEIVIVVGHPAYYPRFGFSTESAQRLKSPFPREAFMALELRQGALAGLHGLVRYPAAFGL